MAINSFSEAKAAIGNAIYGSQVREAMVYALQYILDNSSVDELNSKVDKSNPYSNGKFSHGANNTVTGSSDSHPAAFGYGNTVSGVHAFAVGFGNNATNDESFAEGVSTVASGAHSHAAGSYTVANTNDLFVVGRYNNPLTYTDDNERKNLLFCVGAGTDSNHKLNAFYVNKYGSVFVNNGLRIGSQNTMSDTLSGGFVCGNNNTVSSHANNIAVGFENESSGDVSFAEGVSTVASGAHSHAAGFHTRATGSNQFVVGQYNTTDADALFIVGNGTSSVSSNALVVKNDGDTVCQNLYSTYKVDAPFVNCTNCKASSVSSSEINASDDVNLVDTNGNVEFSVRDFREAVDNYTLCINLPIGDRDVSDPFTDGDLEICEYFGGLIGGRHYTPSELYSLYRNGAVVRMNISRGNGRVLSFTLNDAAPIGTDGQLTFMFSKNGLGSISTITLISNSAQTHYAQETYIIKQIP